MNNLFANLPKQLDAEQFDALLATPDLKIERILSHGQVTPEGNGTIKRSMNGYCCCRALPGCNMKMVQK